MKQVQELTKSVSGELSNTAGKEFHNTLYYITITSKFFYLMSQKKPNRKRLLSTGNSVLPRNHAACKAQHYCTSKNYAIVNIPTSSSVSSTFSYINIGVCNIWSMTSSFV